MLQNIKTAKILILILFVYSACTTYFCVSNNFSSTTIGQINQLNAQINSLRIELEKEKKDNENLAAIRAMMEKELAEREDGQRRHVESLNNLKPMFRGFDSFDFEPFKP